MKKSFELIEGLNNVMLSAPHAVEQTRNGKIKFAEPRTKNILEHLCGNFNCHGIYKTINNNEDANYDEVCNYKEFLIFYIRRNNIKYLLDFHQMSPLRTEEINIGSGFGKNIQNNDILLKKLIEAFKKENFSCSIDIPFSASYENTVSARIAKECNIPAFQLEINTKLLTDKNYFKKICKSLSFFIKTLEK